MFFPTKNDHFGVEVGGTIIFGNTHRNPFASGGTTKRILGIAEAETSGGD